MGASTATIEQLARDVVEIRHPETALRALTALRQELESMEPALVQRALRAGASWSHVARALGVSKQAAHRKYRHLTDRSPNDAAGGAKILVTSEARLSIQFAREEAKRLGQPAVGTEHILLGILRCNRSHAVRALGALGVTHRTASHCLCTTLPGVPVEDRGGANPGDGVSEHARRILEGSLREALNHGDGYIGVEHLLLALLTDSRNGAVQTLETLRATPAKIRAQLEREWKAISRSADARASSPAPEGGSEAPGPGATESANTLAGALPAT
jgi:ATP-dependent Clp protease ATP-binding subunit ClpA